MCFQLALNGLPHYVRSKKWEAREKENVYVILVLFSVSPLLTSHSLRLTIIYDIADIRTRPARSNNLVNSSGNVVSVNANFEAIAF